MSVPNGVDKTQNSGFAFLAAQLGGLGSRSEGRPARAKCAAWPPAELAPSERARARASPTTLDRFDITRSVRHSAEPESDQGLWSGRRLTPSPGKKTRKPENRMPGVRVQDMPQPRILKQYNAHAVRRHRLREDWTLAHWFPTAPYPRGSNQYGSLRKSPSTASEATCDFGPSGVSLTARGGPGMGDTGLENEPGDHASCYRPCLLG